MKAVNSYVEQTLLPAFRFGNGYGNFGYTTLFDLQRESGRRRFAIHYAGRMNILLDLGYSKKVEDAITTPTSPRYLGTTKDGLWSGKLMAYIPDAKNTHFVEMNWQERKIDGIEYLQNGKRMEKKENIKCITKSIRSTYQKLKR